jgi:outer membrane protein TolC
LVAAAGLAVLLPTTAQAQTHSVTLDDAIELALLVNPSVVRARGQVSTAGASKRQAIGSFLPTISGSGSASRNSSSRFDDRTQTTITGAANSYSTGLSASLQLFDGFRRFAENRSASADLASADAGLVNQEFQVILQTKQAFFNALAANDLVRVSERRIERAREQLRVSIDKLAAGSAIRSDTLRGRVELGTAELQRLNAETQRATAEANLARLIGVDGTVRPIADSVLYQPVPVDTAQLRTEAVTLSPVVLQADADARAAEASVAVSRAQYFPTINASYSRSWAGQELGSLDPSWSARLSLNWPIFNGFTRETNMTRSAVNRDAALADAEDARRQVNAQLTQYVAALAAAEQSFSIAEASRAAADEELRVQQERYRLGAATILDVLASQISLDQAEVDIVQARLDFRVAKAQIEALVGREL